MDTSSAHKQRHVKPLAPLLAKERESNQTSSEQASGPLRRPQITTKPWGYEELWALTDTYAAKVLFVRRGEKLSLQYHETKEETLRVMRGAMLLDIEVDGELRMQHMIESECVHIPPNTTHRIEAVTDCWIIETSSTELDDVVRLEDKYGRIGGNDV